MYFILLFFIICVQYSSAENVFSTSNKSQCVLPENMLNDCAELILGTEDQLKKLYLWHVALYRLKQNAAKSSPIHVCSGTLISMSVVITAAHCLSDDLDGSLRNISEYYIAAGNEFREIDDQRDASRQVRQIKKVIIPSVYTGYTTNFVGDFAIVELKEPFIRSIVVKPACLPINSFEARRQGQTVGWGLTVASRHPDTQLTRLSVPYIDIATCFREIDPEFHKYLTVDKICGEFSNGASICSTDNGGGLLYTAKDAQGIVRWYLDGVASVSLIGGGSCETKQYSTFTLVNDFLSLICESVIN